MVAVLVLLSALLHALWNALLKKQRDKDVVGAAIFGVAALASSAVALVNWAMARIVPFPVASGITWSAAAGLFEAAYLTFLVLALDRAPLAVAYTISRGLAIVAVWPLSIALLDERFSALGLAGSAILCLGIAASGIGRGSGSPRGLLFACLCGLSIAGYHLCYKQALATGGQPAAVLAVSDAVAFPIIVACLGRARYPELGRALRSRPWMLVLLGCLSAASFLIFLVALGRGGAGFVLTLRNTSIVFAALIGWTLGEVPTRQQLTGAVLVAAGAMVVGASR